MHFLSIHTLALCPGPYSVKLCTPIAHPNVFGGWICLSMLKSYTGNVPYEGWSGAYSATSVLMQLQSFLFAEWIDQDYGGEVKARTSKSSVNRSIRVCREFKCGCSHSHSAPWPAIGAEAVHLPYIKLHLVNPEQDRDRVTIHGHWCQSVVTPKPSKQTIRVLRFDRNEGMELERQFKGTMFCHVACKVVGH